MHITRSFVNHDYIEVTMTTSMSMSLCTCVIESGIKCKSSRQHASGKGHTCVFINIDNIATTHQNKM